MRSLPHRYHRRTPQPIVLFLLVGALALAGCGGGGAKTSSGDDTSTKNAATDDTQSNDDPGDTTTSAAAAPGSTVVPDPCTLITPEDIKATFGADAEAGVLGSNNTCEYGGLSSDLEIDGVGASLRVSADRMTSSRPAFDSAYAGSGGYGGGDAAALKGLGVIAYSRLGAESSSGLASEVASAVVLTSGGITVNVELNVVNSHDQAELRTPASKTKLETITRTAVGRIG